MGRTDPFPRIHPKGPTASLVSKKVLASIVGQIVITSAFQFWAFFWARAQPWCVFSVSKYARRTDAVLGIPRRRQMILAPRVTGSKHITLRTQYYSWSHRSNMSWLPQYSALGRRIASQCGLTVSTVYSTTLSRSLLITYSTVLLMISIGVLVLFSVVVLLIPPGFIVSFLELMTIPATARMILLLAVTLNVALSMGFEQWGAQAIAQMIGYASKLRKHRRVRDGKAYKAIESTE